MNNGKHPYDYEDERDFDPKIGIPVWLLIIFVTLYLYYHVLRWVF